MSARSLVVLLSCVFLLSACGGGGDSGTSDQREPQSLVFLADKNADDAVELFTVLEDGSGGPPEQLSPAGYEVSSFVISPDGRRVAFRALTDTNSDGTIDFNDGPSELWWGSVDASAAPQVISGVLSSFSDIREFDWSPTSDKLVFRADVDTDDVDEIYLVTDANPKPVKINGAVGSTVEMGDAIWSPDGRYVAQVVRNRSNRFIIDRVAINVYDTTLGAPNSTRLTGATLAGSCYPSVGGCGNISSPAGANIGSEIRWAPDSSRIGYTIDNQDTTIQPANTRLAYQAFPDGSHNRVTGPISADENGGFRLAWSDDSRYLASQIFGANSGASALELFDTTTDSTQRVLNVPVGGLLQNFQWRPGANELAVRYAEVMGDRNDVYWVAATDDGSQTPPRLSVLPASDATVTHFDWAPDGSRLMYYSVDTTASTPALYTVVPNATAPQPIKISHATTSTFNDARALGEIWLPSSDRILYGFGDGFYVAPADQADAALSIDGDLNHRVDFGSSTAERARVSRLSTNPDLQLIGMIAERDGDGIGRLFTIGPDGTGRTELSGSIVTGGDVRTFQFAEPR